jgi:DNA repair protein RecN (Recombination protein N)
MIEHLSIQNLILVERAEIDFGSSLNIITGETGSGKSAILTAIRLILGERADTQWIRNGADAAVIEATIRGSLTIDGMDIPSPFIVRRELHRSGRSRCFIEENQVTLQELRLIPIELVDQSASLKLCEAASQRQLLDIYGQIPSFAPHYLALRAAQKKLDDLLQLQQTGLVDLQRLEEDLQRIEEINWQEGEEESLQTQHNLLTHSTELLEKTTDLTFLLSEDTNPILPTLKRYTHQIESLIRIEPKFHDCTECLKLATLNLEEASHFLTSYSNQLEVDPNRLVAVETRIGQIESLKRRFGPFAQVQQTKLSLQEKIGKLSNLDEEIDQAKKELGTLETTVNQIAKKLTDARKKTALRFAEAILAELKSLNLPDARFTIEITPKPLSENGADEIRYLFSANPGQPLEPLDQCASGGELSRILFALKTAIGDKEGSTCLIFDEIDSNVGGKTAAILGAKLEKLAKSRQLICVTHFVQVAKCAKDHFLVTKTGAQTRIQKLDPTSCIQEYSRMTGIS